MVLTRFTETIELTTYDDIRAALFNPQLSRTFDRRSYGRLRMLINRINDW